MHFMPLSLHLLLVCLWFVVLLWLTVESVQPWWLGTRLFMARPETRPTGGISNLDRPRPIECQKPLCNMHNDRGSMSSADGDDAR